VAEGYHALERFVGALVSLRSQVETLYVHASELIDQAKSHASQVAKDAGILKTAVAELYATLVSAVKDIEAAGPVAARRKRRAGISSR